MDDYPRTIEEFEERFATEERCWEYLVKLRWPDGFRWSEVWCRQSYLGPNHHIPVLRV